MSSKKIYNTIGMGQEIWDTVAALAEKEERTRSFVIEKILRDYFEGRKEKSVYAD